MARGIKTGGGSRKGRPNKATLFHQQQLWELIYAREQNGTAANPYVFLLDLMTDEAADMSHRVQAATFLGARLLPSLKAVDARVQGQVVTRYEVELI